MEAPDLAELVQRPGPFLTVQLAHHAGHWSDLPFHEFGCWQTLPVLAPLLQLRQPLPPHVLVVADRSEADITAVGTEVSHHSVSALVQVLDGSRSIDGSAGVDSQPSSNGQGKAAQPRPES